MGPFHLAGDGHHDLIDVFAPGHQAAVAFAEADLGFPANLLDGFGHFFHPQLQAATDFGRVAIGPRALHEDAAGMSVTGLGEAPLPASFPTGGFTGHQSPVAHQVAGRLEAREIAQFGDQGDGRGELNPAQCLERFHHWQPAPGLD